MEAQQRHVTASSSVIQPPQEQDQKKNKEEQDQQIPSASSPQTTRTTSSSQNATKQKKRKRRMFEWLGCFLFGVFVQEWFTTSFMMTEKTKPPTLSTSSTLSYSTVVDATNNSSQQQQKEEEENAVVNIVFVVGLEGTGHHLMGSLLEHSPSNKQLGVEGIQRQEIQSMLWRHPAKKIWMADMRTRSGLSEVQRHRNRQRQLAEKNLTRYIDVQQQQQRQEAELQASQQLRRRIKKITKRQPHRGRHQGRQAPTNGDFDGLWDIHCRNSITIPDTENLQSKLIYRLKSLVDEIQKQKQDTVTKSSSEDNTTTPAMYALNTIPPFDAGYGEVSYPNYGHPYCRTLAYPNLDLWYDGVCTKIPAVSCQHVYLYRDVVDILHSTTVKREFNPTYLSGIRAYETMYHIMASQVFSPSQLNHHNSTIGCFGFYDLDDPNAKSNWVDGIRLLGGWSNNEITEYNEYLMKTYKPPSHSTTASQNNNSASSSSESKTSTMLSQNKEFYDIYLKPLRRLHDHVLQLCKSNLQ